MQLEYRDRDTDQGDIELRFDPDEFFPDDRRHIDDQVARIGARLSLSPASTVLVSGIGGEIEDKFDFVDMFADELGGSITETTNERLKDTGYQLEAQHLFTAASYQLVSGFGVSRTELDSDEVFAVDGDVQSATASTSEQTQENGYVYGGVGWPGNVQWTLGLAAIDLDQPTRDKQELAPKLGIEWDVTDDVRLRGAIFKTVKRPVVVEQTIEPTEVAGFNQLYDEANGTEAIQFGLGFDTRLAAGLFGGLAAVHRDVDFPFGPVTEQRDENLLTGYLYWAVNSQIAVTLNASYETFDNEDPLAFNIDAPKRIETVTVPLAIRYFSPTGLFVQVQTTYLRQDLKRGSQAFLPDGDDSEFLLDGAVGFRLPARRGILSVEIRNALDQNFFFQDNQFRSPQVTKGAEFVPERTVLVRATLDF